MTDLNALISALPKAELHLHLEGSLEPEQLMQFAERNQVDIPFKTLDEVKAAYNFSNLQDFLDIYYQGMDYLEYAGNRTNFIVLDACRNNPLPASMRNAPQGLASSQRVRGTLIAYSTAPGMAAPKRAMITAMT